MAVKKNDQKGPKPDGRYNDTRQRLLQKAKELYFQRGYAGISQQDLAESIGISKAALFHHFKSKQELFYEIQLDICENYRVTIQQAIKEATGTRARLLNILMALSRHNFFDPMKFLSDEFQLLDHSQQQTINEAFYQAISSPIEEVLEEGMRAGELKIRHKGIAVAVFMNMAMLLPSPGNPAVQYIPPDQHQMYVEELLNFFWGGIGASA